MLGSIEEQELGRENIKDYIRRMMEEFIILMISNTEIT